MNLERIGNEQHEVFDSLEEFDNYSIPLCRMNNPHAQLSSLEAGYGNNWFGPVSGAKEAREKIKNGWSEIMPYIQKMMDQINVIPEVAPHQSLSRRRKLSRDSHGDNLDITRVWLGDLQRAWSRPKKRMLHHVTDKRATIVINVGCNANISFYQTLWRAVAALKICDVLTNSGRSVEIYCGDSTKNLTMFSPSLSLYLQIRVKEFTQPLDMERLAAMSTTAFLRTHLFVGAGARKEQVNHGLGQAIEGLPIQLHRRKEAGELIVEMGATYSLEQAVEDINKVHKQLLGASYESTDLENSISEVR
jgi:hypothetical protein